MTSLLFIPAVINKEGELKVPDDNQLPWIPREYLEPMCESVLSFGQMSDLDAFYNSIDSDRFQITSYGINDGYYFIRTNANLMNVAVSRAKDAFIVFGDLRGFQNNSKSPDGLLKKAVCYVR